MRPVDKGIQNHNFEPYQLALEPLANRLGRYCSYCEMQVYNSLEVEHVVSISKGGAKYEWQNFLLSCKHCNGKSNKSDKVVTRGNYLWPDEDNTFLAFEYSETFHVRPHAGLSTTYQPHATSTVQLLGLNRFPGSTNPPTFGDKRYIKRNETWGIAKESLLNWQQVPLPEMVRQIVKTAQGHGFFSIWMTVFKDISEIKLALIDAFPGTAKNCFDQNGNPVARPGGKI